MDIEEIVGRVRGIEHRFLPMLAEAERIAGAWTRVERLAVGKALLGSDAYQGRAIGVFVLGMIAHEAPEAFALLIDTVSLDASWQVQEILAKAFDNFCAQIGYEQAVPVIQQWLGHTNPNVRRAASEGLRIWTARPYFRDNPHVAVRMLAGLRGDPSEYVRKSVGNALRDISRKHKALVQDEVAGWDVSNRHVAQAYKLASRFIGEE